MTSFLVFVLIIVIFIIVVNLCEIPSPKPEPKPKPVVPYVPRPIKWFYSTSAQNMPNHPNRGHKAFSFLDNESIIVWGDYDNPSKDDMIVCIMKSGKIGVYKVTGFSTCSQRSSFDGPSEYVLPVKILGTFDEQKNNFHYGQRITRDNPQWFIMD